MEQEMTFLGCQDHFSCRGRRHSAESTQLRHCLYPAAISPDGGAPLDQPDQRVEFRWKALFFRLHFESGSQDEVRKILMVRSAATPRVSNHMAVITRRSHP
jgi:hypothetical protein